MWCHKWENLHMTLGDRWQSNCRCNKMWIIRTHDHLQSCEWGIYEKKMNSVLAFGSHSQRLLLCRLSPKSGKQNKTKQQTNPIDTLGLSASGMGHSTCVKIRRLNVGLWEVCWNMGSVLFIFSSLCTESESLSDKQDKIQTQMFQNIATIETMFFSVCSESPGRLSDTPDIQYLAWHRNGKASLLFKEASIILSLVSSI